MDKFVTEVNTVMHQKDEHERLSVIIDKLEAYDAIETPNEESKELVADYCRIDLTCPVPGCGPHQRRNLLMEGSLKLKDAYTRVGSLQVIKMSYAVPWLRVHITRQQCVKL